MREMTLKGLLIAATIVSAWACMLTLGLSGSVTGGYAALVVVATAFLYTGVFITAHDAMHGLVAPSLPRLNAAIGRTCTFLYAALPYGVLLTAHHEHHAHPGRDEDPDYHHGRGGFLGWYARFFLRYATVTQFVVMAVIFNVLHHLVGVPLGRLWVFWIVPQLLSTVQLFGVGTWWPHRPGADIANNPHRARSLAVSPWLSFLACYHFGYHHEHHEHPSLPWWRLPTARSGAMNGTTSVGAAALFVMMALAPSASADPPVATANRANMSYASTPAPEIDLSGLWVQRQDTSTLSRVATIGRVRATTTSIVLYDLEHDGGSIQGSGLVCDIRIDSGTSFVDTIIPDAFLAALPVPRLSASVSESNGVIRLEQPRTWSVLGAQLDEPTSDPLPTDPADPRVRDTDADGQPGVTVRIGGLVSGDVYVVQRGWSRFAGTFDGADRASGEVEFGQDQVVLDASRRVLRTQPPTEPDTTPGANTFSLQRLPAGSGCREAVEAALRSGR